MSVARLVRETCVKLSCYNTLRPSSVTHDKARRRLHATRPTYIGGDRRHGDARAHAPDEDCLSLCTPAQRLPTQTSRTLSPTPQRKTLLALSRPKVLPSETTDTTTVDIRRTNITKTCSVFSKEDLFGHAPCGHCAVEILHPPGDREARPHTHRDAASSSAAARARINTRTCASVSWTAAAAKLASWCVEPRCVVRWSVRARAAPAPHCSSGPCLSASAAAAASRARPRVP